MVFLGQRRIGHLIVVLSFSPIVSFLSLGDLNLLVIDFRETILIHELAMDEQDDLECIS